MFVTLAVYSKEVPRVLKQLAWINELGGVRHRTLVLATTSQVDPAPLLALARQGWGRVEHFVIQMNNEVLPWPMGNNANFYAVCQYMNPKKQPFFFMESDVLPLRDSWLDELESEYRMNAKPFLGDVHGMADQHGNAVANSDHMNGSGVYPAEVMGYLPTLPYITMDGALARSPWDVALRFEIMYLVDRSGGFQGDAAGQRIPICHATKRICFCWKSFDYQADPVTGLWTCRTEPQIMHRQIDLNTHLLHHGCKDDSLLNLLRARLQAQRGHAAAPLALTPPVATVAPVEAQPAAPEQPFKTLMGEQAFNDAMVYARTRQDTPDQIAAMRQQMLAHEQRVLDQAAAEDAAAKAGDANAPAPVPEVAQAPVAALPPAIPVPAPVPEPVAVPEPQPAPRNPPVIPGGFQTGRAAMAFADWKLTAEMMGTTPEAVETKRVEMLTKEANALDGMFSAPATPAATTTPPRAAPRTIAPKQRGKSKATPPKANSAA